MKFTIKKDLLLDALSKVSKAISTKNLIPVLAGIKFELKKKKLTLTASDNDITIQTTIESVNDDEFKIDSEGSIIIQGKYILDIVRKLPDQYINVEVIDEYTNVGWEESKKKININAGVLKSIVNQTAFATSNEESKPVLTGINFNIVGDILECNSTDSYRLARKIVKLEKVSEDNYNIVIPSHNLIEFTKILGDDSEEVEVHIFNNKVLFKNGNLKFESRLINGTYPNTSNLLPDDSFLVITTSLGMISGIIDPVNTT